MKKIIGLFFLLVVFSCSNKQEKLNSSPAINSIFTPAEIVELNNLLLFFENQICTDNNPIHSNECYKSYLKNVSKNMTNQGGIFINISYKEQSEMFKQLNDSIINQIWSYGEIINTKTQDTLIELRFNPNGKYVKMLHQLSLEDKFIKYYYETWKEWGSPQIITSGGALENYQNYDINDVRMKLIIAIHYLTMNDNFERNREN